MILTVTASALSGAFSALVFVRNRVNTLKINQLSIIRLLERCDDFMAFLDTIAHQQDLTKCAKELQQLLNDIGLFIAEHSKCQLLQRVLNADGLNRSLRDFNERLTLLAESIECKLFYNIQKMRQQDDQDREKDYQHVLLYLQELENREGKLMEALELREEQYKEALYIMNKKMRLIKNDVEKQFLLTASACIQRVSNASGSKPKWLIPQWDITLKHKIASGGYGDIYIGFWNKSMVAIKVMKPNADSKCSFVDEVEVWHSELSRHPHILPLYGACHTVESPFMVCEYMPNGHLIQYLRAHPDQNIRTLKEAALGLEHLHNCGIIHGDIKAINILINGEGTAKICDFGFSFVKTDEKVAIGGTLRWMAPELVNKEQPDFPADVYAFGMTMYEVFNNYRPPYCTLEDDQVKKYILSGAIPDRLLSMDDTLWSIVTKCLCLDPKERLTISEVVNHLSELPTANVHTPIQPETPSKSNKSSIRLTTTSIISSCDHLLLKGDEASIMEAIDKLYKAACGGNVHALMRLGDMYATGKYVNKDLKIARDYFERAAASDHEKAHLRLGYYYLRQCDPPKVDKGMYHLRCAADRGNASAMNYFGNEIQQQSPCDAFQWFLLAAEKQYMKAYLNLGECYLYGLGTSVNVDEGLRQLTISAEQGGNAAAWKGLGDVYSNLGGYLEFEPYFDLKKAVYCFTMAIDLGFKSALVDLSQIYFHGHGMQMDARDRKEKSRQLLVEATRCQVLDAFFLLGKSYEDGLHQAPHEELASYYYHLGADAGCEQCKIALKMKKKSPLMKRISSIFTSK